jgi:hypothetical protein
MNIDTETWDSPMNLAVVQISSIQDNTPSSQSSLSEHTPTESTSIHKCGTAGPLVSSPTIDCTNTPRPERSLEARPGDPIPSPHPSNPLLLIPNIVPSTPHSQVGPSRWRTIKSAIHGIPSMGSPP